MDVDWSAKNSHTRLRVQSPSALSLVPNLNCLAPHVKGQEVDTAIMQISEPNASHFPGFAANCSQTTFISGFAWPKKRIAVVVFVP